MSGDSLKLFSFRGKSRILHLTWLAFFICFFAWFNHAPLLMAIADSLSLSSQQVKTLLILNVALTIPARIIVGMLTDKYGPRRTYSALLLVGSVPCFIFALADSFAAAALSRFLLGFVGAAFVIGIRMVSEWFPARQLGTAEGIYGGWGNFGSAAGAMSLPAVALVFGGEDGWRYAVGLTGVLCVVYGCIYYFSVTDTPKGATYFKPKKMGAMEVTSPGDLVLLLVMRLPLYAALALLTWKLSGEAGLLSGFWATIIYSGLGLLYLLDVRKSFSVNREMLTTPPEPLLRYKFKQVAVLNLLYFITFGSELAVISMLPLFFSETFTLSPVMAGLLGSSYAVMNLLARPAGGLISDRCGRKATLLVLVAGLAAGYCVMSQIGDNWPLFLAVATTMGCAFFVQASSGAVFAMVPLIKRRLTGQIAGMTGAYGNVGAVCFLTVLSLVSYQTFFLVIAATAAVGFAALFLLEEPQGHMAEVMPDGSVSLIDVA
ncbi:NarK family nitrate/nitrite MFS transporter [Microbulbifer halophilus]|uniref:Nitrate/nitrite transporter n=1 Tax=Microbulbifer halophilus TaxID=453963 RepID=A0ABW5EAZ5_9GAMM|nr:NarK family nitrate/nitrite MFS transporter [Microbulbifer halophilus]MCW8125811.1 NarK family nitrate/nitrite MFS transporter [Microbulbifer halophilus]